VQMKSLVTVEVFGPFSLGCKITCCENVHFHLRHALYVLSHQSRVHLRPPAPFTSHTAMSLLQDVLRNQTLDSIERRFDTTHPDSDGSDEELINVMSIPGTPSLSRPSTRPGSPSPGAVSRSIISKSSNCRARSDPLKAFPTHLSQRIFGFLDISDLAKCARVCKKWRSSQSINYVWFRRYRQENFNDESLPPGKWTRPESKQDWRILYIQSIPARESVGSGYTTSNTRSGYQSPREMKEEQWRNEALGVSRPSKGDMREMYKELGGRKSKSKAKVGGTGRVRDKGGLGGYEEW